MKWDDGYMRPGDFGLKFFTIDLKLVFKKKQTVFSPQCPSLVTLWNLLSTKFLLQNLFNVKGPKLFYYIKLEFLSMIWIFENIFKFY